MLLVGAAVSLVKFNKHDTAGTEIVGLRLRIDYPAVDLNEIVIETEGDAQLLPRFKELAWFPGASRSR